MSSLPERHIRLMQLCVAALWLCAIAIGIRWMVLYDVPVHRVPIMLFGMIRAYGVWGPVIILGLYVLRSVFFLLPLTVLTVVTGSLYGPFWGTILNVIGENLTANISFALARLFGRRFVRERQTGWVKKYDELLHKEGFLTVMFMRALYFPFDIVNYGSGMTGIVYRQYAVGSFVGLLPSIITLTVLGNAFTNPRAFVAFAAMVVLTIAGAFLARRSSWIKRRLYSEHVQETI